MWRWAPPNAALQAAQIIADSGAKLEVMTPDRSFAPEVMAMNLVPYMRGLQKLARNNPDWLPSPKQARTITGRNAWR